MKIVYELVFIHCLKVTNFTTYFKRRQNNEYCTGVKLVMPIS